METSLFIAQVMGWYLLAVSLMMLFFADTFKRRIQEVIANPAIMTMSGILALLLGIMVVVAHNVWVLHWPVIITLLGWLMIVQGFLRLLCPERLVEKAHLMLQSKAYIVLALIVLFVSVCLLYLSYF